jgi:iron complex outermembrane receptor protein
LARSVGANATMADVERVEILKGPQGTLFGRNSIGGAISIVTRQPGPDFMFRSEVTTGQFNRLDVKVMADLPISDVLHTSTSQAGSKSNR